MTAPRENQDEAEIVANAGGQAAAELPSDDVEAIECLRDAHRNIRRELAKVIVGQDDVIEQLLIGVFARGHCLLEGVPGLAKTLLISSLAQALQLKFKRIQFTPDLMPSDITGTEVIQDDPQTGKRQFKFLAGPIFANVILADEINRTPPKTQAALLEAMQERQVSIGGAVYKLDDPFFVLATQNPLEQEGTYPLPEAQQDRFLFKIFVDYPSNEEEGLIMKSVTAAKPEPIAPVLGGADILALQSVVRRVPVAEHIFNYAKRIVRSTRPGRQEALALANEWIAWGAGPRASINLIVAARVRAVLAGQVHVSCADVAAVAKPVLRHRIAPNFAAQAEGHTADRLVEMILKEIPTDEA
jgi:MoxR-like ATPase